MPLAVRPTARKRLVQREIRRVPHGRAGGLQVASDRLMSFAGAVDRVRDDFNDMPGLELTVPQAVRLWHLGVDDCRSVVDALVDGGFLRWTARGTIVRTGRERRGEGAGVDPAHISVRTTQGRNKSVWR